ncbi:hypothetical protein NDU88_003989 [Pleurodeles waltl]|uniref:Uncharacterized protein n=1 Tax=Pleurodeles waltl TaxID=8319 RepID=A0AAV7VIZ4_PLEWA|nr:hypothetical protein NDU88_003989 [Pleurodeles waltl]
MCAPRFSGAEPGWRAAEAVWWRRAALELRRARKGVARIPLRGNSSSGGRNSGSGVAAAEKTPQGAQLKETAVKEPRRNTSKYIITIASACEGQIYYACHSCLIL